VNIFLKNLGINYFNNALLKMSFGGTIIAEAFLPDNGTMVFSKFGLFGEKGIVKNAVFDFL